MGRESLQTSIETIWESGDELSVHDVECARQTIECVIAKLDSGELRVANKISEKWIVCQWIKKAILLYLKLGKMQLTGGGTGGVRSWDKVPMKFHGWGEAEFSEADIRCAPGNVVRWGSYIAPKAIVMPSFINVGAYIDTGTVVDSWATIGSAAQIGKNCHISDSAGIAGVLEPLQANPVIIEDNCFIGARSEIAEGVVIGQGSVIGMGVHLGASTKIIERSTGKIIYGYIPPYSVVIPGSISDRSTSTDQQMISINCAVIVKRVDEKTRARTEINDLLRNW